MSEKDNPKGSEEKISSENENDCATPQRRNVEQLTFSNVVENGTRAFFEDPINRSQFQIDPTEFDEALTTNDLIELKHFTQWAQRYADNTNTDLSAVVQFVSAGLGIDESGPAITSDNDAYSLYADSQNLRLQEVRNLVADALEWTDEEGNQLDRRRLDQTALYLFDPTKFTELAKSRDYRPFRLANGILQRRLPDLLHSIMPRKHSERTKLKRVKVVDLGLGDGRKSYTTISKIIEETGLHVDFYGDDSSQFMNFIAHYGLVRNIVSRAVNLSKQPNMMWEGGPYADLVSFIRKYKLSLTNDHLILFRIFNIFYEYTNQYDQMVVKKGGEPDLLKFMIARLLSLHQKTGHTDQIKKLDEEVNLPITLHPINKNMKDLDPALFKPGDDEMTLFFDLGSRCNNEPFEETLKNAKRLLGKPVIRPYAKNKKPYRLKERDIDAQRYVLGHLILNFDPESVEENDPVVKEMMAHFKSEVANIFAIHLFHDHRIYIVIDNETNEELERLNIYYPALTPEGPEPSDEELAEKGYFARLVITFEEDTRDAPGVYGAVHRLKFIKPVTIRIKATRQKSANNKLVEEIKEYKEEPGSEVLIIPSYTPELMQRLKVLADNDFHVIDFYPNKKNKPTHVKIVFRKMLPHEKIRYEKTGKTKAMKKLYKMLQRESSGVFKVPSAQADIDKSTIVKPTRRNNKTYADKKSKSASK